MNIALRASKRNAVIVLDHPGGIDDLIASFALSLIDRGLRVRGVIQTVHWSRNGNCYPALFDLDSCRPYPLNRHCEGGVGIGAGHTLSAALRNIAETGADLIVFDRFSDEEAVGRGAAAEIRLLLESETPLLAIVKRPQYGAWKTLAGETGIELPARMESLHDWVFSVFSGLHGEASGVKTATRAVLKDMH